MMASSASIPSQPPTVLVKTALHLTLEKSEFKATNPRMEAVRNIGRRLLELPEENVAFNSFCDEIVSILRSNFKQIGRCRSGASKREHLWREFHKQSLEILPAKWKKLYTDLTPLVGKAEQLFDQTVNTVVYGQLLKEHFVASKPSRYSKSIVEELQLTKDEMNALRYASGYVARKLLKKYENKHSRKKVGIKAEQFEECLGNMAVADDETDFTKCTSEWIRRIDRGGLFPVNDTTLIFFVAVEKVTRQNLPHQYCKEKDESTCIKQSVIKAITEDNDVQFYWTLISQDIEKEDHAIELLLDIADMWVKIRGFSLASSWLEEYKKKTRASKSRALRKDLYRKVIPPTGTDVTNKKDKEGKEDTADDSDDDTEYD